jgi:Luciferase-like monooxygenase
MQIGITIANHRDLLSPPYIQTTARMAEDLGFDSVWIPDHIVAPRAVEERYGPVYYDAMAVLAYLAGITRRVRLGTTVLVVPSRHAAARSARVARLVPYQREHATCPLPALYGAGAGACRGSQQAVHGREPRTTLGRPAADQGPGRLACGLKHPNERHGAVLLGTRHPGTGGGAQPACTRGSAPPPVRRGLTPTGTPQPTGTASRQGKVRLSEPDQVVHGAG